MSNEHIVKSFAQELQRLSNLITQMGGVAEAQVGSPSRRSSVGIRPSLPR